MQRIAIVAFACNPWKGSEEGVGWAWANCVARCFPNAMIDVFVSQHDYNDCLIHNVLENLTFRKVPKSRFDIDLRLTVWRAIESGVFKWLYHFAYSLWISRAAKQISVGCYDYVHLITYVGLAFPLQLDGKSARRLIWGPVGGALYSDISIFRYLGFASRLRMRLRNIYVKRAYRKDGVMAAIQNSVVIAAGPATQSNIASAFSCKPLLRPEVVMDFLGPPLNLCEIDVPKLEILWISPRATDLKGINLLSKIVEKLDGGRFRLNVAGGVSPKKFNALKKSNSELTIENWGWVSDQKKEHFFCRGHIVINTSLIDLTSTALVECVSRSKPVVCLDINEFQSVVINSFNGFRIKPNRKVSIPDEYISILDLYFFNRNELVLHSQNCEYVIKERFSSKQLERFIKGAYGTFD